MCHTSVGYVALGVLNVEVPQRSQAVEPAAMPQQHTWHIEGPWQREKIDRRERRGLGRERVRFDGGGCAGRGEMERKMGDLEVCG